MLLFIFAAFLIGFVLGLFFIRSIRGALIWGTVLGVVPLALMLGPGSLPVEGIGSVLNFAIFALGPLMLVPFIASGVALGVAGAAGVLWVAQGRAKWVGWAAGLALVGFFAGVTLVPVATREMDKRQAAQDRDTRAQAIMLADFKGTFAGHRVGFPASPRLYLYDECAPGVRAVSWGCSTTLDNPVTILTKPADVLLHERSDPINFLSIHVLHAEPECARKFRCLPQEKVDRWCADLRPDQADSIWCRDAPPRGFAFRTDATPGPSDRDEPELAAAFADTSLGAGRVACFYHPDPTKSDRQGQSCKLRFHMADGVMATMWARREQITSGDPVLAATLALIPDYWAALTGEP